MPVSSAMRTKNIAIAVATAFVIALSVWISFDPGHYYFHEESDRAAWTHPTGHVLTVCAFYVAEGLFFAISLRIGHRLWPRATLAALLFAPWAAFSSIFVMHAPGYLHVHVLWTWLVLAALAVAAIGSAIRHVWDRMRSASNNV